MVRSFLFVLLAFFTATLNAQQPLNGKITIKIADKATPIEGATVELRTASDAKLVKTEVSAKDGVALFENIPAGSYTVTATAMGFAKATTAAFELSASQASIELPSLALEVASQQLTG